MNHNDGIKSQHLNFLTIDSIMKFLNVDCHNYGMSNSDYNYDIKVVIITVMIDVPFYLNDISISTSVFLLIAALYLKKHDLLKHNDHFDYDFLITVNFNLTMAFFLNFRPLSQKVWFTKAW